MLGVYVSQLDVLHRIDKLGVHEPKFVVESLVHGNMKNQSREVVALPPQPFYAIDVDVPQQLIDFLRQMGLFYLADEGSQDDDYLWVIVEDAEVEAVEEGHRVVVDVLAVV